MTTAVAPPEAGTPAARASLYRKVAAVTAAVGRIPKNGFNKFFNYAYALESDITDELREILRDNGLAFLPPTVLDWQRSETLKKGGERGDDLTRVQMQFELADCDTGEVYTTVLWGEGQDGGDKGFYKAYTGAVKYFLMKTFLMSTGDDPEHQTEATEATRQANGTTSAPPRTQSPPTEGPRCPTHSRYPAKEKRDGTGWYCSSKVGEDADGKPQYCRWTAPKIAAPPPPPAPAAEAPAEKPLAEALLEIAESMGWEKPELRAWLEKEGLINGRTIEPRAIFALLAYKAEVEKAMDSTVEDTEVISEQAAF